MRVGWGRLVSTEAPSYKGSRFPVEIISHCVWLYHRFPLSFREVEEMMLQRGIVVSHETIRQWCAKYPWWAVDQHGAVLNVLVISRRNARLRPGSFVSC